MIKDVKDAIEFINDHTDDDEICDIEGNITISRSLVLIDDNLYYFLDFLERQEQEKQELKAELDKVQTELNRSNPLKREYYIYKYNKEPEDIPLWQIEDEDELLLRQFIEAEQAIKEVK